VAGDRLVHADMENVIHVRQPSGVFGVDPGPLTLRELLWMAEARAREAWAHTSAVLALIANVNRDPNLRSGPGLSALLDRIMYRLHCAEAWCVGLFALP
jgi:hypothetical protein